MPTTATVTEKPTTPAVVTEGKSDVKPKVDSKKFAGAVCSWGFLPDHKPRLYVAINVTFGDLQRWFFRTTYNDVTGKGFQRATIAAHKNKLYNEMMERNFTPAAMAASVTKWHENLLEYSKDRKTVTIIVDANHPLALTDGGHRYEAQLRLWNEAGEELKAHIESQMHTVLVYLDSKSLQKDFINLQKGRSVDSNQLLSMNIKNNLLDPKIRPFMEMAHDVARNLNRDKDSVLFGQVKFGSASSGVINLKAITTKNSSDLGTSMYGGAKVALAHEKGPEWLAQCYNEAYKALSEYAEQAENSDPPISDVLTPGKILTPAIMEGGTKGGTAMVLGIGNLWAWRKAFFDIEKTSERDFERIAEIADSVLNSEVRGQSGEDKRIAMGAFARQYFADVILKPGEAESKNKVAGEQGVPKPLLELLSYGTYKVEKPEKVQTEEEETDEEETPVSSNGNGQPKRGRGRPRKNSK